MGEIDTKPVDSVQSAVSFFDHSNEQRQISPKREEKEQRTDNDLAKELASVKVQLEVKDSIYKQTLLKLDHHQKISDELSKLLKNSDHQKNFYINEFQDANARINELESTMNMMANKLSESEKLQEQLTVVNTELAWTHGQLVNMEREFSSLKQEKDYFVAESEVLRSDLNEEKRRTEDVNELILGLEAKIDAIKLEKDDALLKKGVELESAEKALAETQEKLEKALKDLDVLVDLENQLVEKSALVQSLEMDLKRANELQRSSENAASDAIFELNKVKGSMALLEVRIVDQTAHTDLLEIEIKQLKTELGKAKEELGRLSEHVEALTTELESSKEKENDAQVEIAMLKFEVHKAKSKLAASEIEKSALFNALQDMGLELEERKRENRVLREEVEMVRQSENGSTSSECRMLIKIGDVNDNPSAETLNQSTNELENVKKELETAISKVGEFRNRAEQAISRAEAAEKAKAELELQIKKMKEHKERRKAALLALREESVSRDFGGGTKYDHSATTYQTLGKVLKLKF